MTDLIAPLTHINDCSAHCAGTMWFTRKLCSFPFVGDVIPKRIYPSGTYGQIIFENEKKCLNLHYVGITRAVKACVLMTSTSRINRQGEVKNAAPSQFINRNDQARREVRTQLLQRTSKTA
ncbi:hypothetical protein PWG14_08295 (plasmid) [Chromobacterium amazonense]|uniref:hypothetical protein n=1 Tax=Chromobacterium amazonense TaxID=1382803 RepID=UPI00237E3ED8|nr:hypothetical protein [Chromobacterium amazonense]MDE1712684.1 hypothetical protein [Chromobacterium amazonense]